MIKTDLSMECKDGSTCTKSMRYITIIESKKKNHMIISNYAHNYAK